MPPIRDDVNLNITQNEFMLLSQIIDTCVNVLSNQPLTQRIKDQLDNINELREKLLLQLNTNLSFAEIDIIMEEEEENE